MPKTNGNLEDENLEAPLRLLTALRKLQPEPIFIPPTLNEAVLRAARRHLQRPEKTRFGRFRLIPWAAAVAMLALALFLAQLFTKPASKTSRIPAFAREDVNRDGRVDILDALALARQLKAGSTAGLQLDVNGDGVVDDRDVATIASQAVKLEKGGRS